MPIFCITWRLPGARTRAVIIIIIYVLAFRFAPDAAVPLAFGGIIGAWFAARRTSAGQRAAWLMLRPGASSEDAQ
jgi:hypothetical protein